MTAQVTIVGNLTREPEIRYTTAGVATTTLGIAVNRRWKHHGSEEAEERLTSMKRRHHWCSYCHLTQFIL